MKTKIFFYSTIFLFLILQIFFIFYSKSVMWDEAVYLSNARYYLGYGNYVEEFRFPLLSRLLALLFLFTKESIIIARIFIVFLSIVSVIFLYKISKLLMKKEPYYIFSILTLLSFFPFFFYSFRVYSDIPAMSFTIASFFFFLYFINKKSTIHLFFSSFFSILAFLTRFSTFIFPLSFLLFLIYIKDYKNSLKFIIFLLLVYSPWAFYSLMLFKNPFWHLFEQSKAIFLWTNWQPFWLHIFYLLEYSSYLILLPFLLFKVKIIHKKDPQLLIFFLIIVHILYFSFFVKLKDIRYAIQYFFLFSLLFPITLENLSNKIRINKVVIKKGLFLFFLFIILLIYFLFSFISTLNFIKKENNDLILISSQYLNETQNKNLTILSNSWVYYAYYLNAKSYSLWNKNITYLINLYHPDLIIYSNYIGITYNETVLKDCCNKLKTFRKGNKYITIYQK